MRRAVRAGEPQERWATKDFARMDTTEVLYLLVAPIILVAGALSFPKRQLGEFVAWPVVLLAVVLAAFGVLVIGDQVTAATVILMVVVPGTVALLPVSFPGIRERPWSLIVTIPVSYFLAVILAINIGLALGLFTL